MLTGLDRGGLGGVQSMLLSSVWVFLPAAVFSFQVSFILRRALCTEVSISVLLRGESKRPFD